MKKLIFLFVFTPAIIIAQTHTEVYLFDLKKVNQKYLLVNKRNISKNKGYDSQPSFYDNNTLLFSSTRNNQTDIVKYDMSSGEKKFVNSTPNGGEYSPQRIPGSKHVSAVRLDKSGLQRFYTYDIKTGTSKELIADLVVAYPFWYTENIVVSAVIGEDSLELVVSNLKDKTNHTVQKKVGRSFHRIPNTNKVSFISKQDSIWEVRSLDMRKLTSEKIISLDGQYEDICWLPDGTILQAKKNQILKYNPKTDKNWSVFFTTDDRITQNISRIIVSPDGNKISIVGEESPRFIVQKQVEAYNNRDIDAFMNTYADDVKVYSFPKKLRYQGAEKMRERYKTMFENTKDLHCTIVKRIEKGNKVIDQESVIKNGKRIHAVAIYEVKNGKIATVTFL